MNSTKTPNKRKGKIHHYQWVNATSCGVSRKQGDHIIVIAWSDRDHLSDDDKKRLCKRCW